MPVDGIGADHDVLLTIVESTLTRSTELVGWVSSIPPPLWGGEGEGEDESDL